MGVIYKITSPSNKVYVGKTYDLRKRIYGHRHCSKKGSSIVLHNSIKKYGWNAHILETIETVEDNELNEREIYWIAELKTYIYENDNGLNMTKGGEGQRSTWMHKVELRKWYSERFKGSGGPFYGKHHSEENKKLLSKMAYDRAILKGTRIPKWGVEKMLEMCRKEIICYEANGVFYSEYISLMDASRKLKIKRGNIGDSLKNNACVYGKYFFKYKTENYPMSIEVGKIKKVKRPILCFLNSFVLEYSDAAKAASDLGIPKTTIARAAQYNNYKPIRTKHIFAYKDDYEKKMAS